MIPSKRVKRSAEGADEKIGEAAPKPKKAVKRPTVFKAGKWNPDTVLVEEEIEKCGKSSEPDYSCC